MSELNKVKVVIDQEVYVLSSSEDEEHIQTVARYIDKKIREIYSVKSEAGINNRLKTLFISLNIADDLFKEKEARLAAEKEMDCMHNVINDYSKEISKLEEENSLLADRIKELQNELTISRNELEEYIEVFEINDAVRRGKVTKLQR